MELRDRAIAQCFGVDCENDIYKITLQFFNSSDSVEGRATDKNSIIAKSEGKTLTEAISNLDELLGKNIFLGNNKIILIGEKTAQRGIVDILNFFDSDYQTRVKTTMLICEGKAEELISGKSDTGTISAKDIYTAVKINTNHGIIGDSDILSAQVVLNSRVCNGFLLGFLKTYEENKKTLPQIVGSGVFKDGKMIYILDKDLSEGVALVMGKPQIICINEEFADGSEFAVTIQNPRSKMKAVADSSGAKIDIDVNFNGKIAELKNRDNIKINQQQTEIAEKICEKKLREKIEGAILKSKELGCDFFDFANCLSVKNVDFVNENKEMWEDTIKNIEIRVNVDGTLQRPI